MDTFVNPGPNVEQLVAMLVLAAREVRSSGLEIQVAMFSSPNSGTCDLRGAIKMREAAASLRERPPNSRSRAKSTWTWRLVRLCATANLLVMSNLEVANISHNLLKSSGQGLSLGPMLVCTSYPMHMLTASETVRSIINMTVVAAVDAQEHGKARQKAG